MSNESITKPNFSRVLIGFTSGWAASVLVAFFWGVLFTLYALEGHRIDFIKAIGHGSEDAFNSLLFVAGTITTVAAIIALVTTIIVAIPLYFLSVYKQMISMRIYVAAGFVIALFIAVTIIAVQIWAFPQAVHEVYWLEFVSILMAGPAYTTTFWLVVFRRSKETGE